MLEGKIAGKLVKTRAPHINGQFNKSKGLAPLVWDASVAPTVAFWGV